MNSLQRAKVVARLLDQYIPNPQISLDHTNPFTLLVAVCLSAQCTDLRVNRITPALFDLAPNPLEMTKAEVEKIEAIIRPCGLASNKARRLKAMAKQLIEHHKGQVPCDFEALEALEGVGHKTASVVISQAFHQPAFAVDTHILRSAKRWKLSCHLHVQGVEEDLKKLFAKSLWSKIHLQIILYARQYCPARAHQISSCPICLHLAEIAT
jgi:endonuclease-3